MRLLYIKRNNPKFEFTSDWEFHDVNVVGQPTDQVRIYNQNTIPQNGLWKNSFKNGNLYLLRVDWEDSLNCPPTGINDEIQSASARVSISTSQEQKIYFNWRGIGELQDTNFEMMKIYIDNYPLGIMDYWASFYNYYLRFWARDVNDTYYLTKGTSQDLDKACTEFGPIIHEDNYPGGLPYYVLSPGNHEIIIKATTYDQLYHVNCYYEFEILLF